MPNSRSEESKGVIVMFRGDFLDKIDSAMEKMGYSDRSSLIRAAVYDLLKKHGITVHPIDKTIPGRKGKGGRPNKISSSPKLGDERPPQVAEGGRKSHTARKPKLSPVPGTGKPDEKAQAG